MFRRKSAPALLLLLALASPPSALPQQLGLGLGHLLNRLKEIAAPTQRALRQPDATIVRQPGGRAVQVPL